MLSVWTALLIFMVAGTTFAAFRRLSPAVTCLHPASSFRCRIFLANRINALWENAQDSFHLLAGSSPPHSINEN